MTGYRDWKLFINSKIPDCIPNCSISGCDINKAIKHLINFMISSQLKITKKDMCNTLLESLCFTNFNIQASLNTKISAYISFI